MLTKEIMLAKGLTIRIDAAAGDELRVRTGSVWLTQESDTRDHVLGGGQRLALNGKGLTLVKALKPALMEIRRVEPAAVLQPVSAMLGRALALLYP